LNNIIFTSPYSEITEVTKILAKEMNLELHIIESALDEAIDLINQYIANSNINTNTNNIIVISRGATAKLIEKELSEAYLIRAEPTEFDLIHALNEAKKTDKKIGVLGTIEEENRLKIDTISQILNINAAGYWYSNSEEFSVAMEKAKSDGIEILVGGGLRGQLLCQEYGIKHIPLITGRSTIEQSLSRAKDITETRKKERENSAVIRTIVDLSNEGIIAINSDRKVVVFNHKAALQFQIDPQKVLNKRVEELTEHNPTISKLFHGASNSKEDLAVLPNATLLVNRAPYNAEKNEGLIISFQDITKIQESEQQIRRELYNKGLIARYQFQDIIYTSNIMSKTINKAKRFAKVDSNVLIIGESGTGKELLAQSIHNAHTKRKIGPFIAINCAALSDTLLESELFGYEHGAFTGAHKKGKAGLFELAHTGTIFLDEIDKVSLDLQSKLLRVLQEREIRRIGGDRNIPINVRVIAAANKDLRILCMKGEFREDLYYRLEVLVLKLPPLRERKEDIPHLVNFMLEKYISHRKEKNLYVNELITKKLSELTWPGNLRQLENMIERCVVLSENPKDFNLILEEFIEEEIKQQSNQFKENLSSSKDPNKLLIKIDSMEEIQKNVVRQMLSKSMGKSEIAKKLNISRTTLWKLIKDVNEDNFKVN
jgi:transcriptional regulator with PAS, ATPase and Fis domain